MRALKIDNDNNKLNCSGGFIHIGFAPPKAHFAKDLQVVPSIREQDFDKLYSIKMGESDIIVKLHSFIRLKFYQISCLYTIPGYGVDSFDFKTEFKEKYPATTEETEMAVYCYTKLINP